MLYASEAFLARLIEYLLHGASHPRLDIPVEVVEGKSESLGKRLAYGGLAGSHITYKDNACHYIVYAYFFLAAVLFLGAGGFLMISIHSSYVSSAAF